ncbi:hypothetical protein MPL3365_150131 [Mesorhizobium plurifarium]|uniref:Uncharacterized protein n=1 Tax=Mesorhizobium plurifarium TaxID=69974 RepID=A0A090G4W0_MESPL|nr:hypothetical protein MPL3365_150131 [Mesorhizobium plurifarium]
MDDHRCARQGHHGDDLQHQGRRQLPARHVRDRLHGEQRIEHENALKPLTWRAVSSFVILGRSDAKRSGDPRIHAVALAEERCGAKGHRPVPAFGAEVCTVAALARHGMDSRVCARRFAPCSALERRG